MFIHIIVDKLVSTFRGVRNYFTCEELPATKTKKTIAALVVVCRACCSALYYHWWHL